MTNWLIAGISAFAAGAGLYPLMPWHDWLWVGAFGCIAAVLLVRRQHLQQALWLMVLLLFIAGVLRAFHAHALSPVDISRYAGQQVTAVGRVKSVTVTALADGRELHVRYHLAVEEVRLGQEARTGAGGLLVSVRQPGERPVMTAGDKMAAKGEIWLPHNYNNPVAYDSVGSLRREGITARLSVKPDSVRTIDIEAGPVSWQARLDGWRAGIQQRMQAVMPPHSASVLRGMVFGGYTGIPPAVVKDFAATGIVHILAVSGTHIALVAGLFLTLGKVLRLRAAVTALLAGGAVCLYAVASGLTPTVTRSALMGLIGLLALALGREKDGPAALFVSGFFMVAYQPSLLYDISFQLSFTSTAGLIFLYPLCLERLSFLPEAIAGGLAVTLSAQLAVLPFIAWYFNSFSLSAFIANLLIIPVVELAVIVGLCGMIMAGVLGSGAAVLFSLSGILIDWVVQAVTLLAKLPAASIYVPSVPVVIGLGYYLLLTWAADLFSWRTALGRAGWLAAKGMVLAAGAGLLLYCFYPQPLTVHFIDVGQGDAALIITPHGRAVLVDAGGTNGQDVSFDVGERVVAPYLKHYGVRNIDYLILTHGHQDHAGGAAGVAAAVPAKVLLLAQEEYSEAVKNLLAMQSGRVIPAYPGQKMVLDGVVFEVVYAAGSQERSSNENSSVIRVEYGQHSFLLTGDLERQGEAKMLAAATVLPVTVLKVGHHGARKSTSEELLTALSPTYAVISAGYRNQFGHPHPELLDRLRRRSITVLRTDQDGAVVFRSDGKKLAVSKFVH